MPRFLRRWSRIGSHIFLIQTGSREFVHPVDQEARVRGISIVVILFAWAGSFGLARAADVPVPSPVYQDPNQDISSEPEWSGIYLGVLLGYTFGQSDVDPGSSVDVNGADGGVFAGYNFQANNWVVGVEADALLSGVEGSGGGTSVDQEWAASLRLRAGYSLESFLLYGTGGLAVSGIELAAGGAKDNETQLGWTVGAGIESLITDNVTARVEYRYSDYEDKVFSLGGPAKADLTTNSVRAGVGVKF